MISLFKLFQTLAAVNALETLGIERPRQAGVAFGKHLVLDHVVSFYSIRR
jgi:hypothetical protein